MRKRHDPESRYLALRAYSEKRTGGTLMSDASSVGLGANRASLQDLQSTPTEGAKPVRARELKKALFGIALAAVVTFCYFDAVLPMQTAVDMKSIKDRVAQEAVAQYQMARRQGDPIQTCVQAGVAASAYLQAQDEGHFRNWKRIESDVCKAAGLR
jgi:hypothetical protein